MTTPTERTRALRWAGEFLREVGSSDGFSEELRRKVNVILRHYPTPTQLEAWVASEADKDHINPLRETWLGLEGEVQSER